MADQAIIATGGKQYIVSPGDSINIESIDGDAGDSIEFFSDGTLWFAMGLSGADGGILVAT